MSERYFGDLLNDIADYQAQLAERDAEIAQLKAQVAELQAALNNTPLDTLRRYFHGTMQIDGIYSDDEYLVDSDMIERWFKDMD